MTRQIRSMRNWTAVMILLSCCLAASVNGSAIPMWEFLSKEEKMSHLYKVFAKQVARYCADSSSPDCNKNLLVVGVRNLASIDENELDRMDPYQRGANDMIWRAFVRGSRLPTKYGHEEYMGEDDPFVTGENDNNGLGEESARINDYVRPSDHAGPYLVGPMVIRVFPDGRPVPEDAERPLPRDEDIEDIKYSKVPSVSEIEVNSPRQLYNRPSYDSLVSLNSLNSHVPEKSVPRPSLIPISRNSYYRRYNPIFRERVPELSNRNIRYY